MALADAAQLLDIVVFAKFADGTLSRRLAQWYRIVPQRLIEAL